jgi:hypothetical protein
MHPFNLIIHHVLEQISRDYSIAIKYSDYLIPLVSRPLKATSKSDTSINVPQTQTPYPNALPISKMKRSDLLQELKHYNLPTEGTVSEMKVLLKEHRVKAPKVKRKKQPKRRDYVPPLHEHSPTDQLVIGCAFCDSHGNSLASSFSTGTVF